MFIMYKNQMFYGIPEEGTKAQGFRTGIFSIVTFLHIFLLDY
jgi:hypothetical protein